MAAERTTHETPVRAWAAGEELDAGVSEVLQRGVQQKLLKFMPASGVRSSGGVDEAPSRRRSSAPSGSAEGKWAFHHLRMGDEVSQGLLRDDAASLHGACARALDGADRGPQMQREGRFGVCVRPRHRSHGAEEHKTCTYSRGSIKQIFLRTQRIALPPF